MIEALCHVRRRPAKLHRALIAYDRARLGQHRPTPSLVPSLLLIAVGLWAAFAAEFTTEAWPLAVVAALPVIGFGVSWFTNRRPTLVKRPRRAGRALIDRRPLLLRRVIVLPPTRRRRRITGVLPHAVRLDATGGKPSRGIVHRTGRLKARVHSA